VAAGRVGTGNKGTGVVDCRTATGLLPVIGTFLLRTALLCASFTAVFAGVRDFCAVFRLVFELFFSETADFRDFFPAPDVFCAEAAIFFATNGFSSGFFVFFAAIIGLFVAFFSSVVVLCAVFFPVVAGFPAFCAVL
jgi:hypothetical protein